jgi:hypothetical protein
MGKKSDRVIDYPSKLAGKLWRYYPSSRTRLLFNFSSSVLREPLIIPNYIQGVKN